jgi:hypothetical protein
LWIEIDHEDSLAPLRERGTEVDNRGGLRAAAFLSRDGDDSDAPS